MPFDIPVIHVLLAMVLIFIGCFIQSAIGFGLSIVSAPLLFQLSPGYVPGPVILVALFLSLVNAYTFKSSMSLKGLGMAVIGRIPGSICGGALLLIIDAQQLALMIGAIVLAAVIVSLLPKKIQPTPFRLLLAGYFSGLFGTSASIGGPPLALLLQHEEANLIRANLSAFFVVSCIISVFVLVPIGHLRWDHVLLTLPLLPACFLGYLLAMRFVHRIPKQKVRYASLVVCSISGITAIVSAFL